MNIYLLSLVIVFSISNLYCLIKIAKLKNELDFMKEETKYTHRLEDELFYIKDELEGKKQEIEKLQSFARTNYEALEKKNKKIVELEKRIKGE